NCSADLPSQTLFLTLQFFTRPHDPHHNHCSSPISRSLERDERLFVIQSRKTAREGTLENNALSPSAIVGCAKSARSRAARAPILVKRLELSRRWGGHGR